MNIVYSFDDIMALKDFIIIDNLLGKYHNSIRTLGIIFKFFSKELSFFYIFFLVRLYKERYIWKELVFYILNY